MGAPGDVSFVSRTRQLAFTKPNEVLVARTIQEVLPALMRVERFLADGNWAAGFIAYEAAPAFDSALASHSPGDLPLLWFGIYDQPCLPEFTPRNYTVGPWRAGVSESDYAERVSRIRSYIGAGDTYQVNFTFPMFAAFSGDAQSWFHDLARAQQADHCAYVHSGRFQLACVSPELFFKLESGALTMRPMKGTRARGRWTEEDKSTALELARSPKDRAENVMIVDLIRNDMGRISEIGSVKVDSLFTVERYPTIWQMTSEIHSRTKASVSEILAALFPSGSVTGAPKIRTMQIIRELESHRRGAYCGTIGWMAPDGSASFNVAIRCATIDTDNGSATYPVGSGITWDSLPENEYAECRTKAAVLTDRRPPFELLETILYSDGFFLLEEHLRRLAGSAEYFGIACDSESIRALLQESTVGLGSETRRIRLLVDQTGFARLEVLPLSPARKVTLGFAPTPVNSKDIFLYHKTTRRDIYEAALKSRQDCADVILWNEKGEITECCTANIVADFEGTLCTPPVACGLLAGTFRETLLREGRIVERVIAKEDLRHARAVHLINSVRRWIPVDRIL